MQAPVVDVLKNLEVLEPVTRDVFQVFGLRHDGLEPHSYATLDESLVAKTLEITEVSERGSVPDLKVTNKGDVPVLLVAGEQLIGAKQNRVLNASCLIAARSDAIITVSCVEMGRWGYRTRAFMSSGSSSHGSLRRAVSSQVLDAYKSGEKKARAEQGAVWMEVSRKLSSMGSKSASSALEQAYEDYEKRLAEFSGKLELADHCNGVVFVVDGNIAGVDLFDKPETMRKLFPKLANAYALDAVESRLRHEKRSGAGEDSEGVATSELASGDVQNWLGDASSCSTREFESPGIGKDVRLEGDRHVGAALALEDSFVHLELFPRDVRPGSAEQDE